MKNKIQKIIVLVELDNGNVHQVLSSGDQKEICLTILKSENGILRISDRVEPVTFEKFQNNPCNP